MKKLIFFLAFLCLVCTVASSEDQIDLIMKEMQGKPTKEIFKVFHFLYKKTYSVDSNEGIRKYKVFKSNLEWINKKNNQLGKEVYGITQFMDLTDEEFRRTYLMDPIVMEEAMSEISGKKYDTVNKEEKRLEFSLDDVDDEDKPRAGDIDWRHSLQPAKNQGSCGSCWAFAAVASIEGALKINQGKEVNLSEQYLVDCDISDSGCNGGWPTKTFEWLKQNGVIEQSQSPYKATQSLCRTSQYASIRQNHIKGFENCGKDVPKACTREIWLSLLSKGPIVVAMDASDDGFSKYKPKNFEAWEPKKCDKVNHAVTAVGFVTEGEVDYLIVRNSWGASWGSNGYFKVPADKHCGILDYAWLPVTQEHQPFPEPKCPKFYSECGYKGNSISSCDGVTDFNKSIGSKLQSLYLDGNKDSKVYYNFFREPNCRGKPEWNYEQFECAAKHWSFKKMNITSAVSDSISAPRGCILYYEQPCFVGGPNVICNSIPDLTKVNFQFTSGSFYIYDYTVKSVVLFEEANYTGVGFGIKNKSVYNTDDIRGLNEALKKTKSILVVPKQIGE